MLNLNLDGNMRRFTCVDEMIAKLKLAYVDDADRSYIVRKAKRFETVYAVWDQYAAEIEGKRVLIVGNDLKSVRQRQATIRQEV